MTPVVNHSCSQTFHLSLPACFSLLTLNKHRSRQGRAVSEAAWLCLCSLIERHVWLSWCCLLQEMIQLDDIPNLASLVSSFDQQQLANFCRILAVTISELDTGSDDKHTLLAKNAQQKKNLGPSPAEINQGNCYIVSKCRRISTVCEVSLLSMSHL